MNIGSLYLVKKWHWLLFASKETAVLLGAEGVDYGEGHGNVAFTASYWSKRYDCEVTYFSPDSIVVFLEEDGEYKKVITSDGKIGWICFVEDYNDCFEEVKSE